MGGDGDTGLEFKDLERQQLYPYTTYSLYHYSSYFTCILNIFKKILALVIFTLIKPSLWF